MSLKVEDIRNDQNLDFNEAFAKAFDLLENSQSNLFITGKAGTGKSTLLQYFRDHTSKDVAVVAPTGVAALNVKGQTLHSFFRFRPDITQEGVANIRLRKQQREIFKNLDMLIVDEISMVRADILDCVDAFLKRFGPRPDLPFGGVQMVFFGDLFQLPPVVRNQERDIFRGFYASPFFFSAQSFSSLKMKILELSTIYRQQEEDFIRLLGSVRSKSMGAKELMALNKRFQPRFQPQEDDFYIYLTSTNALADRINRERLASLQTRPYVFEGEVLGEFDEKNLPTHLDLDLKYDAQVMMLNNDPNGRWINGSLGKIKDVNEDANIVRVELTDGSIVDVEPFTWEMYRFYFDEDLGELVSDSVGAFRQFPLKLAWAVTIHKSQGQTFDKVIIDVGRGTFAHGQMYVALSRCTNFDGLILKQPINARDIILDDAVLEFMKAAECEAYSE